MGKYKVIESGEWIRINQKGLNHACCDCSLVHKIYFKIVMEGKKKILYGMCIKNSRATAAMRRQNKAKSLINKNKST